MSASMKKTAATSSSKAQKASSAPKAVAPSKKIQAAVPATKTPAKTPALKVSAKTPAKRMTSREAMLARVESVRLDQRSGGHFDCFGRAGEGYCDQGDCAYHAECLSVSRMLHSL